MNKYIAMNRFKIAIGRESDFEDIWQNRETHLDDVKGFQTFNLLKGSTSEEIPYILLIVLGNLKLILKIGKNQKHLEKHIVEGDSIKAFI